MRKLFYVFVISILFISCSKREISFEFPDGIKVYNIDNELEQRVKTFVDLFDNTSFPIDRNIKVFSYTDKETELRGSCFNYDTNNGKDKNIGLAFNYHYEIDDNVIIHELCHAALKCHNLRAKNHDTPEWNNLCDFFERLGFNPIRTGAADYPVKTMD